MQFLQPALLWGTLAIAIPIALHFWHQKKGREIDWAATRFLFEKNQQSRRGLRLDQILLLALRCLILLTLAVLLSEPFFKNKKTAALQKIHLVQPDDFVVENYRFELERAREKGEAIYWLTPETPVADELTPPAPDRQPWNPVVVQSTLNRRAREGEEWRLYIKNERPAHALPQVLTPAEFRLHAAADTLSRVVRDYRLLADDQKLYVAADNYLRVAEADAAVTFAAQPAGEGTFLAKFNLKNPLERKTTQAALRAFGEVYNLEIDTVEEENAARPFDLVIGETTPAAPNPATLYIVTHQAGLSARPNVVYFPEKLTPQASPLVARANCPNGWGSGFWRIGG